ncbi:MAG: molybdenum ABC transporter ATP-binding protein [Alphaproteobacteria bacterium]|nr:molybdenum ABC transporter ATP-binding protein [Alphaproteobacteria bacterium]
MSLSLDVRHRLGTFEIDVRFESAGGVCALFGPSGAGKTTLVNMIAGLINPQQGRIVVSGQVMFDSNDGTNLPPPARAVGYVFQDARLFPHLSVQQNLKYGRWFSKRRGTAEFDKTVDILGLGALLRRKPVTLSGGEKQRVAIGRALLSNPRLLLMDEPLAALDQARKDDILNTIEKMRDAFKIPIVYVSHSVAETDRLATQIVHIESGRVVDIRSNSNP